jgi:hypothetical protein
MTHDLTVHTFQLLKAYFVSAERKALHRFRLQRRTASHKIRRATHFATGQLRNVEGKSDSPPDFTDPVSQQVLDAIADALVEPLARQAARADFAEWLVTQREHQ